MKNKMSKKLIIILFIATIFISIGYASVNSVLLEVNGNLYAEKLDNIFITDVKYVEDVSADKENSKINRAYKTTLNSSIVLSDNDPNSSITYQITIYNSTNESYYFRKVEYLEDKTTYSNENIVFKIDGLLEEGELKSKESIIFNITFSYKDNILPENNTLDSYLNFVFKKKNSIEYINILQDNLPETFYDGEELTIDLKDKAPQKLNIYVNDEITTDYTYSNYLLTIPNATGNLKIEGIIGTPELSNSNLVPVYYNDNDDNWHIAGNNDTWYDYGKQIWGNAVILKENITLEKGSIIDIDQDVRAMFVWIPRYEYKITSDGSNEILINFLEENQNTASDGYIIHPAFTFGNVSLNGIWVGKFETSTDPTTNCYSNPSNDNCSGIVDIYIKPNVKSLREQEVSTQFNNALNFSRFLTDDKLTSHMMKNSEWGGVAYLSQSKYGKYGNEHYTNQNKEVYINNSSTLITGKSGGAFDSQTGIFDYNYGFKIGQFLTQDNGVGASTTGNITGVYDMNGGTYEYVMGYLTTASSTFGSAYDYNHAGFSEAIDEKYYDKYISTTSSVSCNNGPCYGHALDETAGWYSDNHEFLNVYNPWVLRGGVFDGKESAGVFAYYPMNGYSGAYATFRITLVEEN